MAKLKSLRGPIDNTTSVNLLQYMLNHCKVSTRPILTSARRFEIQSLLSKQTWAFQVKWSNLGNSLLIGFFISNMDQPFLTVDLFIDKQSM